MKFVFRSTFVIKLVVHAQARYLSSLHSTLPIYRDRLSLSFSLVSYLYDPKIMNALILITNFLKMYVKKLLLKIKKHQINLV